MKKGVWALTVLVATVLLFVNPLSSDARGRVFFGARIGVGYPGWWGPRYYWGGPVVGWPYYYAPPPVVVEQPPVYSEPEQEQPYYWYYCQNPQGYYPYVKSCPGGWMQVVPNTTPPNQ